MQHPKSLSFSFVILFLFVAEVRAQQPDLGVGWAEGASPYRGMNGRRIDLICQPAGSANTIWGTDFYTDDSSICTAAAHAGLVTPANGGRVAIVPSAGRPLYASSTRNGVQSREWKDHYGSFSFVPATGDISIGWATTANKLSPAFRERLSLVCPPGGEPSRVWGTGTYSSDSSICSAAVHAGVITVAQGGRFAFEVAPGQTMYIGSTRNGISSASFATFKNSFRIPDGTVASTLGAAATSGTITARAPATTAPTGTTTSAPVSTAIGGRTPIAMGDRTSAKPTCSDADLAPVSQSTQVGSIGSTAVTNTTSGLDSTAAKFYSRISDGQLTVAPVVLVPGAPVYFRNVSLDLFEEVNGTRVSLKTAGVGYPTPIQWQVSDPACIEMIGTAPNTMMTNDLLKCASVQITATVKQPINSSGLPGCSYPAVRSYSTEIKFR